MVNCSYMKLLKYPTTWFIAGIIISLTVGSLYVANQKHQHDSGPHPIGYVDSAEEVHVHSDFVLFIDGEIIDLSDDKYQSNAMQIMHEHIHLHDNNDDVIHRHDHGVTLATFFDSLGFTLTNDCITNDRGREYCTTEDQDLLVFINDERIIDFADYVNQEEDRILIYYGDPQDDAIITELLLSVTDKACIYSGTCPERGTPPPESCGITCEI